MTRCELPWLGDVPFMRPLAGGQRAHDGPGGARVAAEPWGQQDGAGGVRQIVGHLGCVGTMAVGHLSGGDTPAELWALPRQAGTRATGAPEPWGEPSCRGTGGAGGHRAGRGQAAGAAVCPGTALLGAAGPAVTPALAPARCLGLSQQQRLSKQRPWRAELCLPDRLLRKPLPGPAAQGEASVQSTDTCPDTCTPSDSATLEPAIRACKRPGWGPGSPRAG